jgi:hypothetical protein
VHRGTVEQWRCPWCQDPIGLYEPIVVTLPDGSEQTGSRLSLAGELERTGSVAVHAACNLAIVLDFQLYQQFTMLRSSSLPMTVTR